MRRFLTSVPALALLVPALWAGPAAASAQVVEMPGQPAGVVIVRTGERKLYLTLGQGRALRYPVAVGMQGRQWRGSARIDGKYVQPAWAPPPDVKRAKPSIPDYIPPGPNNPMGLRALTLDRGQYAIHGTTKAMRASIGTAASFGCIRMYNEDVVDLYDRVSVGTTVIVEP